MSEKEINFSDVETFAGQVSPVNCGQCGWTRRPGIYKGKDTVWVCSNCHIITHREENGKCSKTVNASNGDVYCEKWSSREGLVVRGIAGTYAESFSIIKRRVKLMLEYYIAATEENVAIVFGVDGDEENKIILELTISREVLTSLKG